MPQHGLHALVGAAVGRRAFAGRVALALGFLLGSLSPDFDILALAVTQLAGGSTAGIHRSLTHSVFLAASLLLLGGLSMPRWRAVGGFMVGAGLGVLGHIALDLVMWFSGVDLLWPLSRMRGWDEVNLWRGVRLPSVAGNPGFVGSQLAALNMPAFALYFGYLGRIARGAGDTRAGRAVRVLAVVCWALFPVYVATGVVLDEGKQNLVLYPLVLLVLLPAASIAGIALRRPLAGVR